MDMQQLTTTSILALFETDKAQRESFVMDMISRIDNGDVDPLKVHLQIKCMEDIIKRATGNTVYKDAVLEAANRQGEKSFQFHNAKFEIKETGVKYDWTKCEDPVLQSLMKDLEELDGKVKDRQAFLKTVPPAGMTIVDDQTGEAVTVYPPAKSSTTNVAVTLK